MHHPCRVVERHYLLAGGDADVQRFWDPEPRDGPETRIKSSREPGLDRHRAETDHGVVSGDRAVRLDVDHDMAHGCTIHGVNAGSRGGVPSWATPPTNASKTAWR